MMLLLKTWLHDGGAVPPQERVDLVYEPPCTELREQATRRR
jgi:hypothetical protein